MTIKLDFSGQLLQFLRCFDLFLFLIHFLFFLFFSIFFLLMVHIIDSPRGSRTRPK